MSDSCAASYRHRVVRPAPISVRRLTHAEFRQSQKLAFSDDRKLIASHYGGRKRRKSAKLLRLF